MYIGIDLGGTNIAAGVVDEAGKIIYKSSVPTLAQRPIEEIVEDMANLCIDVVNGADRQISEIKFVGIGCPGTVDDKNGIVAYACNLRMQNTKLGAILEKKLGKPVNLENDANAAEYPKKATLCGHIHENNYAGYIDDTLICNCACWYQNSKLKGWLIDTKTMEYQEIII